MVISIQMVEIGSMLFTLMFSVVLLWYIRVMKREVSSFRWDAYFEACDIYLGRSHWTRVWKLISSFNK